MKQEQRPASLEQTIAGDVMTGSTAYEHVVALCDRFGGRFAGTAGEAGARDYIQHTFAEYGLRNARSEPFPYTGWQRGSAHLEVTTAEGEVRRLACTALPYCPGCDVTAQLVDAGMGLPEDFARLADALPGQIVLVSSDAPAGRAIHRKEKYGRAVNGGAAAFIFMNASPGALTVTGSLRTDAAAPIPGVGITLEDGAWLRRAVQRQGRALTVRLVASNESGPATSWNVLADLGPAAHAGAAPSLIVGAHYDGHDIAQGAVDDATGVAALLEAARVLAPHAASFRRPIRFIAFGVEELGLIGAYRYVDARTDELRSLDLMLNLDCVGDIGPVAVRSQAWPAVGQFMAELCRGDGLDTPAFDRLTTASDHYPFVLKGIPAVWLFKTEGSHGRGWGHTQADTVDKVDPDSVREAALITARVLLRLLTREGPFPLPHRPTSDVKQVLLDSGLRDSIQFEDRWPFEE